jgi:hypothetical protein
MTIEDWVVDIHDRVNLKLDKPAAEAPAPEWKEFQLQYFSQASYASYVEDMFFFFFTLAANYPLVWTQDTHMAKKYGEFFHTLPKAMAHRPWGEKMAKYISSHPLNDQVLSGGRQALMEWLYGMYVAVLGPVRDGEKIESFKTITKTMERMRKG